jgi:hypothetical protein
VLLWGVVPDGLGRKIRNSAIEATIIPRIMKNMSGLEKAGLFSGGGVGDSMMVRCKYAIPAIFPGFFSAMVEMRFCRGFCENVEAICGFIVVSCGAMRGECGEKTTLKSFTKKVPRC